MRCLACCWRRQTDRESWLQLTRSVKGGGDATPLFAKLLCSLAGTLLFAGARPGAVTLAVAPALALALSATLANARSLAILSRTAIGANAAVLLEAFSLAGSALLFGLRRPTIATSLATASGTLSLALGEGRPCGKQSHSD